MKKLIYLILLLPCLLMAQTNEEYLVFENALIIPNPAKVSQLEAGLAAHNKKYHGEGAFGVRVYWISNGPHTGSYMWVMGPLPWSAMDGRQEMEGHEEDWNTNVLPYTMPEGDQTYWKFDTELSHFPKDFTVNKLLIDMWDIKRGMNEEVMGLVGKVKKVYTEKYPDAVFGIYINEFPNTWDGRDLSVISFFDKSAWLGEDREFAKKYDEVHGEGSFKHFLKDWMDVTNGGQTELWIYRPELSGISGEVKIAERQ